MILKYCSHATCNINIRPPRISVHRVVSLCGIFVVCFFFLLWNFYDDVTSSRTLKRLIYDKISSLHLKLGEIEICFGATIDRKLFSRAQRAGTSADTVSIPLCVRLCVEKVGDKLAKHSMNHSHYIVRHTPFLPVVILPRRCSGNLAHFSPGDAYISYNERKREAKNYEKLQNHLSRLSDICSHREEEKPFV